MQTPVDALARLDQLLDQPGLRVEDDFVRCRACGPAIVSTGAVGVAADRIEAHLQRWCACL